MICRLLPRNRYLRRLAMLSGGTVAGQGLLVGSAPVLTRLYGPEAFGGLAVFIGFAAMLATIASLRYELAIPVVHEEAEAADLVGLGLAAAAVVALASALLVWALAPWLARVSDLPALGLLFWFLPATTLLYGLSTVLSYWSVRRGTFRVNATSRVAVAASQAGGQLALGALGAGAGGLILGYSLGPLTASLRYLHALPTAERAQLLRVRWRRLWPLARAHWHYPAYSAPAALLQIGTQLLPAVLLAALYGPAVAGWFGLGQRVMGLPVKLLAQAASQAFLGEAPRLSGDAAVRRLFLRSTAGFALVGLLGMAPVLILGPWLFALVFGEAWREAGLMAALLVPQHLARFIVIPVSQTLNIYGRQELHLVASFANAAALAAACLTDWWLVLGAMWMVLLYSAGTTLAYLLYLGLAWLVVRAGGLTPRPSQASMHSDPAPTEL